MTTKIDWRFRTGKAGFIDCEGEIVFLHDLPRDSYEILPRSNYTVIDLLGPDRIVLASYVLHEDVIDKMRCTQLQDLVDMINQMVDDLNELSAARKAEEGGTVS